MTRERLQAGLDGSLCSRISSLRYFETIDSTNSYLSREPAPAAGFFSIAVAGHQSAGRGRGDKRWQLPPGAGVCVSISYSFPKRPAQLPALTLSVGVCVARVLDGFLDTEVQLKWPNDLVLNGGKLGGILTELQTVGDRVTVITGFGINCRLPDNFRETLQSPGTLRPVDMAATGVAGSPVDPNVLCSALINAVAQTLERYSSDGFSKSYSEFLRRDFLWGRQLKVTGMASEIAGRASGIGRSGELLISDEDGHVTSVHAGSVELIPDAKRAS